VVLLIGDGLGASLLAGARAYGPGAEGRLELEKLPRLAMLRTHSADSIVTDSAAAGSAFATGARMPNRSVNLGEDGSRPPLISQLARKAGKGVGIVTNTRLTDATPAAFYGCARKREEEASLAEQLVAADFQVALGGGTSWFVPSRVEGSQRKDGRDLMAEARAKGWRTLSRGRELAALRDDREGRRWLGVFGPDDFAYADQKAARADQPSLPDMALAALRRLQREKQGFFLMVEGGMIDKACHMNWTRRALEETLEFDRTIGEVLRAVDERTLVIVTADHECGGFALGGYPPLKTRGDALLARQVSQGFLVGWTSGPGGVAPPEGRGFLDPEFSHPASRYLKAALHTATDVFAAAQGPGAEEVRGFLDNTDLFRIMRRALGL
jgi:alkaline phosphatase